MAALRKAHTVGSSFTQYWVELSLFVSKKPVVMLLESDRQKYLDIEGRVYFVGRGKFITCVRVKMRTLTIDLLSGNFNLGTNE